MTADHIIEKIREAYAKVAEWPEERMSAGAVEDLGPGFLDLLALRNLVPALLSRVEAAEAERDALRKAAEALANQAEHCVIGSSIPGMNIKTAMQYLAEASIAVRRTLAGGNHE